MHGIHTAVRQANIVEDVVELTGRNLLPDGLLDQVAAIGQKAVGSKNAGSWLFLNSFGNLRTSSGASSA